MNEAMASVVFWTTSVPTMPMNHSQNMSLNAWVISAPRSEGRNAAVAKAISEKMKAGVNTAAASSCVSDSMPNCPSTRRIRSTIAAWKGSASAATNSRAGDARGAPRRSR